MVAHKASNKKSANLGEKIGVLIICFIPELVSSKLCNRNNYGSFYFLVGRERKETSLHIVTTSRQAAPSACI